MIVVSKVYLEPNQIQRLTIAYRTTDCWFDDAALYKNIDYNALEIPVTILILGREMQQSVPGEL